MRQILSPLTSKWLTFANFSSFKVFQGFIISTYLLTIKGLQKKKKKDPLVVAVHHHLLPSVMSSLACWHWWFLSEYLIQLSLSLSSCHNHCSLWSVCPLCPFKMRRVMRALENYVSGLFSYSDKISSHIPRSLSLDSLPIPFSWVQWLFVLLTRSHCGWSRSSSAFNIHDGPFSVCSPHGNWMIKMGDLNIQFDTTVKLFCIA